MPLSEILKGLFNNFLRVVKPHFTFLGEHGYQLVEEGIADHFDNGWLVYGSAVLRVEVNRDRGFVSFAIRPMKGFGECDDELLTHLVAGTDYARNDHVRDTAAIAGFLKEHLAEIERLFAPAVVENTLQRVKTLGNQRVALLFPDHPGNVLNTPKDR
jgi:hypothetical protein